MYSHAINLYKTGASLVDVGGESTRPGSKPVNEKQEWNRINKILKLIVRKKTDPKKFERYIDKIYASDVHELKILENFQLQENEEFEAFESEDTLSILNRYVEESEIDLQKSTIQDIIKEVYQEACEVI